jgi:hypothetical protein
MVLTHLGPPSCRRQASASYARSQVLFWRLLRHPQQGTAPRFMTKSLFSIRSVSCQSAPTSFLDKDIVVVGLGPAWRRLPPGDLSSGSRSGSRTEDWSGTGVRDQATLSRQTTGPARLGPQLAGEQRTTTVSHGPSSCACAGSGGIAPSRGGRRFAFTRQGPHSPGLDSGAPRPCADD